MLDLFLLNVEFKDDKVKLIQGRSCYAINFLHYAINLCNKLYWFEEWARGDRDGDVEKIVEYRKMVKKY